MYATASNELHGNTALHDNLLSPDALTPSGGCAFEFNKDDPKDGAEYDRLFDGWFGPHDSRTSFFGPEWAEPYAILIAGKVDNDSEAPWAAFKRCEMGVGADLQNEPWDFCRWFFVLRGAIAQ
ncbi:hypothetical protein BJ138DRAFT_1101630 [Hygrophoropsis aurantiaca]|uniref:Uncharacterized protein n=1 Tax=Hygrophoropsis aurantiaca TaxID=72124 RepID=A0ACB8ABV9_9AGAM|nr:hypothetical protein BJ138DRAFT_1101630 [Hygrophoropsis aurantiaca]